MKINESHITAAEAKEMLFAKLSESEKIKEFMEKVRETVSEGKTEFDFYIGFEGVDITDQEYKYLKSLGYEFDYNKYNYTYTVSFSIE